MRTLILYYDDTMQPHCGCVSHNGLFDPGSETDIEWQDQLTGFALYGDNDDRDIRPYFAVHGIADDQIDQLTVYDEAGNEIGKQYIQR